MENIHTTILCINKWTSEPNPETNQSKAKQRRKNETRTGYFSFATGEKTNIKVQAEKLLTIETCPQLTDFFPPFSSNCPSSLSRSWKRNKYLILPHWAAESIRWRTNTIFFRIYCGVFIFLSFSRVLWIWIKEYASFFICFDFGWTVTVCRRERVNMLYSVP